MSPTAFLKAVRVSGKEAKDSKGKKQGKKETVSKKRKRPAAEGAETDAGTDARTVRTQKNPEVSLPQGLC